MYFADIALPAYWCIVLHFIFINCQLQPPPGDDTGEDDPQADAVRNTPTDQHTFVALIDVVFTDGSKRTCTGSIIHDYVVITAAHCFVAENKKARPELTASFVVIGTKKMFETGYEQYLPIERLRTHPKFKDWTADLALVYTFAGMTSDKPGTVIRLAGERTSTHVESNVTVLSWGHCNDDDLTKIHNTWTKAPKIENTPCPESEEKEDDDLDKNRATASAPLRAKLLHRSSSIEDPRVRHKQQLKKVKNIPKREPNGNKPRNVISHSSHKSLRQETQRQQKLRQYRVDLDEYRQRAQKVSDPKVISRYLTSVEKALQSTEHNHQHISQNNNMPRVGINSSLTDIESDKENVKLRASEEVSQRSDSFSRSTEDFGAHSFKSYYKNWRRQMGPQENKLTVEVFGFVNSQTCKKFIDKAMPGAYDKTGGSDFVCYASDEHYITAEDSGAPAIRQEQLVAVTIGGAECDGDHVAVGIKMACYCSWISENLPSGATPLNCCNNCCGINHKNGGDRTYQFKNKYLV